MPLDELPEGGTPVEVSAVSGAGLESHRGAHDAQARPLAPDAPRRGGRRPTAGRASRSAWRCAAATRPGSRASRSLAWKLDGGEEASADGDAAAVEVADDGRHTVAYRAIDGAGNASEPRAVAVKVDRTPPETVAFEAPDPADPRRVRVVVADRDVGRRERPDRAAPRRRPTGSRCETALERRTASSRCSTTRRSRAGAYELRALVTDVAGNETVGTRRVDGAPAALTLPAAQSHRAGPAPHGPPRCARG